MSPSEGRRRWLTLAELVAVAGVVIAALSLYLSWSDKREAAAAKAGEARAKGVVQLDGTPEGHGATLRLSDPQHKVTAISVRFPSPLGAGAHEALAEPRIEAGWIARPLLKAVDSHEGRLPVLVTADWWDADTRRTDRAVYELVWHSEKGLPLVGGRELKLDGIALRERGGTQARVDQLWAAEKAAG